MARVVWGAWASGRAFCSCMTCHAAPDARRRSAPHGQQNGNIGLTEQHNLAKRLAQYGEQHKTHGVEPGDRRSRDQHMRIAHHTSHITLHTARITHHTSYATNHRLGRQHHHLVEVALRDAEADGARQRQRRRQHRLLHRQSLSRTHHGPRRQFSLGHHDPHQEVVAHERLAAHTNMKTHDPSP